MAAAKIPVQLDLTRQSDPAPARTPGVLGMNDHGDPSMESLMGDTPGPIGGPVPIPYPNFAQDPQPYPTGMNGNLVTHNLGGGALLRLVAQPDDHRNMNPLAPPPPPQPPRVLTPEEFMRRYRRMAVDLDDKKQVNVDVHQYLINVDSSVHNPKAAKSMWGKISQQIDEEVKKRNHHDPAKAASSAAAKPAPQPKVTRAQLIAEIDPAMTDALLQAVPLGKGSPAAIKVFLRLAVRYGVAKAGELQKFADGRHVGLDCSGFVSNFLVARGKLTAADVLNTGASSYYTEKKRRTTLESVKAFDLMVWDDGGHVAIINSNPTAQVVVDPVKEPKHTVLHGRPHSIPALKSHIEYTCDVVESNGGRGLGNESYTLLAVDKFGMFTVQRHTETRHWLVHIVNRDLSP